MASREGDDARDERTVAESVVSPEVLKHRPVQIREPRLSCDIIRQCGFDARMHQIYWFLMHRRIKFISI